MNILVTGSRWYHDRQKVYAALDNCLKKYPNMTLIHGACPPKHLGGVPVGADFFADGWAAERGVKMIAFPANWKDYGNNAGPVRNSEMLLRAKPRLVLAFPSPAAENKGTTDMVTKAKNAGVPVVMME